MPACCVTAERSGSALAAAVAVVAAYLLGLARSFEQLGQ